MWPICRLIFATPLTTIRTFPTIRTWTGTINGVASAAVLAIAALFALLSKFAIRALCLTLQQKRSTWSSSVAFTILYYCYTGTFNGSELSSGELPCCCWYSQCISCSGKKKKLGPAANFAGCILESFNSKSVEFLVFYSIRFNWKRHRKTRAAFVSKSLSSLSRTKRRRISWTKEAG